MPNTPKAQRLKHADVNNNAAIHSRPPAGLGPIVSTTITVLLAPVILDDSMPLHLDPREQTCSVLLMLGEDDQRHFTLIRDAVG